VKADEDGNPDFANPEDSGHDWKAEGYVTKVTGEPTVYADGMRRDATAGKPKFRLMWPKGVPYTQQLMYRVAMKYTQGGEKYGDRNWERSSTEESLAHHEDSLERHLHQFLQGVEDGEDHAAAVVWGVNAVLVTRRNIAARELEEAGSANAERVAGEIEKAKAERLLAKRRQFDKIYGRETAEHSAQLDLEQEIKSQSAAEFDRVTAWEAQALVTDGKASSARQNEDGTYQVTLAGESVEPGSPIDNRVRHVMDAPKAISQYALADQIKRWNREEWSGNRRGTMGEYSEYLAGKLAERFKLSER